MCFGSPKTPNIVYQGPSQADIDASNAALDAFRTTTAENTAAFQTSINNQITAAQASTQSLMDQLADTQANSGAGVENIINDAPYAITTEDNVTPEDAQTTAKISKKKKKPSTLKISAGGLSASTGTGVNYGV
jgi:predicted  nucleic acid-binding Zn-ribbon protein